MDSFTLWIWCICVWMMCATVNRSQFIGKMSSALSSVLELISLQDKQNIKKFSHSGLRLKIGLVLRFVYFLYLWYCKSQILFKKQMTQIIVLGFEWYATVKEMYNTVSWAHHTEDEHITLMVKYYTTLNCNRLT